MKMQKNSRSLIAGALVLLATGFGSSATLAEVVIIAHPASGAAELDAATAKKLFLGKITSLPGMSSVALIGQADSSATKAEFTEKVTNKALNKYKAYWSKMIFSGKAVPPKELADDAEVKAYVAGHADAVGYVDAASVDDSVKVLFRAP